MTGQVSDWLPPGVTTREALRAKLAAAVAAWSEAWFADASLTVSRLSPTPRGETAGWRVYRGAVAVRRADSAAARLLDWALDADVARLSLSDVDHRLVGAFERRLMEDLVLNVEEALGIDGQFLPEPEIAIDPFGRYGGLTVEIGDGDGGAILALAAPLEALLPAVRATLPRAVSLSARLTPLAAALSDIPVTVEAILGASSITLTELQELAVGDVIVLDTALDEAAALSLRGSDETFAHATLTHTDTEGDVALTLQA